MRRFLATTLLLASCTPPPPDLSLQAFSDCRALRAHLVSMARREVSDPWLAQLFPTTGTPASDPWGRTRWSQQPADVPTPFKHIDTDGATLATLAGHAVVLVDVRDPTLPSQAATVPVDGRPTGLFLRDSTVWVLSSLGVDRPAPRADSDIATWRNDGSTLLTAIDISDPVAPRVLRELYLTGRPRAARREGNTLVLVHTEHIRRDRPGDSARTARIRVDEAAPTDWLPQALDHQRNADGSWNTTTGPTCTCEDTWSARHESGPLLTGLTRIDLDDATLAPVGASVVGRADTVSLGRGTLTLAWEAWEGGPWTAPTPETITTTALDLDLEGLPAIATTGTTAGRLPPVASLRDSERIVVLPVLDAGEPELRLMGRAEAQLSEVSAALALPSAPHEVRFVGELAVIEPTDLTQPWTVVSLQDPARPVLIGDFRPGELITAAHVDATGDLIGLAETDGVRVLWTMTSHDLSLQRTELPTPPSSLTPVVGRTQGRPWAAGSAGTEQPVLELLTDGSVATHLLPASWSEGVPDACTGVRASVGIGDNLWFVANTGLLSVQRDRLDTMAAAVRFEGVDPCADRFDDLF